jgi:hypothetical protein
MQITTCQNVNILGFSDEARTWELNFFNFYFPMIQIRPTEQRKCIGSLKNNYIPTLIRVHMHKGKYDNICMFVLLKKVCYSKFFFWTFQSVKGFFGTASAGWPDVYVKNRPKRSSTHFRKKN